MFVTVASILAVHRRNCTIVSIAAVAMRSSTIPIPIIVKTKLDSIQPSIRYIIALNFIIAFAVPFSACVLFYRMCYDVAYAKMTT